VEFAIEYHDIKEVEVNVKAGDTEGTRGLAPLPKDPATRNSQLVTALISSFIRPFDLSKAPLLRVGLMELSGQEHIIMMDIHHIISDGVSYEIFTRELMALYHGEVLPGLRIQYKDYAAWQGGEAEKKRIENQQDFWVKEFADEIPVLALPTDFARPAAQSFEGRQVKTLLDASLTAGIRQMASTVDATLFMALLSIYALLLSRLSGQEDIVVGTPTAGRDHADLQPVFGMFVNTLALRNRPAGEMCFTDFLKEVKERTLAAFANREYLFEDLVEQVEVKRDTGRNPLFDVMFSLMNVDIPEIQVPGLKLKSYPHELSVSKFDLMLYCSEGKEGLFLIFEYCTRLFKHETVEGFAGYFKTLVSAVLDNPQQKIKDIEMISPEERIQILYDFNDTRADYPGDRTIHQLFEEQVERTPDHIALVGPKLQITNNKLQTNNKIQITNYKISLTYRELDNASNQRAGLLRQEGVEPCDLVAIIAQRSLEMMIGIFAILKAGAAYLPVSPDYPQERIDYILADSGTRILVKGDGEIIDLCRGEPLCSSGVSFHHSSYTSHHWEHPAYVIYTSGSTGKPKGVMVEHHSVINRLHWMQRAYPLAEKDKILQKTPVVFDVSVWELFWWSFRGATLVLLGPGEEKSPEAIVKAVREYCISTLHFVPSMLAVFLDYIEDAGRVDTGDLRSIRQVFASGEALGVHQVKSFNRLLYTSNKSRLINLYGPTEATVDVSFFNCDLSDEQTPERIPIGKPIDNIQLAILDRYLKLQPKGLTGELCIAGVGLARGYLNRPELTAERFCLDLYRAYKSYKTYIYRTGDLARWLPDGNIEYLGRMDFQVKIRGFRIELGEIENQLLEKPGIKEAVVIARPDRQGDQYLCAYITGTNTTVDVEGLRQYLAAFMPDYMIPSYFVEIETIPLTPNGKVDRKSLPEPQVSKGEDYTAPRTRTENKLVEIWAETLDAAPPDIGIDDGFFQLGGHSLKATVMINKIHREFQVKLTLAQVFRGASIRQLARLIGEKEQEIYLSIEPAPGKPYYALSAAQKRLYITQKLDPETLTYNMPLPLLLEGDLQVEIFKEALRQIILRHEILRTSIRMMEREPVQFIAANGSPHFEYFEMNPPVTVNPEEAGEYEHLYREFVRPFDLSTAPLLRVRLVKLRKEKYFLVIDMHHIISDGVSGSIFSNELMALYAGQELPPLTLQYKDYSHWQNNLFAGSEIKRQEEYWLKRFEGDIPRLNLPLDYPEPSICDTRCDVYPFHIPAALTAKAGEFIKKTGSTPYILLLAVYTILLSRYCGQEDIIVGSAVAGRRHPDLQNIMGVFINMLVMRNHPMENFGFMEFLDQVKTNALDAYENQDYQFDELVDKLGITVTPGLTPLIDTQFTFQDAADLLENRQIPEVPGLDIKPFPLRNGRMNIQLGLHAWREQDNYKMLWVYLTALFKPSTIENMAKHFVEILEQCMENNEIKLKEIGISHALVAGTTGLTDEDVMDFEF
jgi:tyrocidine synthetase-3